jgi:hypothetical protein
MNRFTLLIFSLFIGLGGFAQSNVVNWTFESKKLSDKKYEVKLIANVQNPWHIYSTTQAEGGPLPTKISFTRNPLASLEGGIKEVGKLEKHFEEVFEIDTKFFNDKVEFVQIVNVKGGKTNLTGKVEFMACTNEQCLPPQEVPFTIALK